MRVSRNPSSRIKRYSGLITAIGGNIEVARTNPRMTDFPPIGSRANANAQHEPNTMDKTVALAATIALLAKA